MGQYDAPLSAEGLRQAESLARELRDRGIGRVVSSTLQRAVRTAEAIAAPLALPAETDPRLNEISYGAWDGLRWDQIEKADPVTARRKLEDWWGVTPKGGEAFPAFYRRLFQAWRSILLDRSRVTAVVAHLGVNAILLDLARSGAARAGDESAPNWERIRSFKQKCGSFIQERVKLRDLK